MTNKLTSYGQVTSGQEARFWDKVNKPEIKSECWNWKTGKKGFFNLNGKTVSAPRLSYELSKNLIGEGLYVSQSCKNEICINPDHLILGPKRFPGIGEISTGLVPKEVSGVVMRPVDQQRFWASAKVTDIEDCWNWQKASDKDGYGKLYVISRYMRSNRVAYQLHYGPLPDDLLVCHKCDNTKCINPSHLFAGSNRDNINDMVSKSRQLQGSRNSSAIMDEFQVLEIKKKLSLGTMTHEQISKEFQCSVSAVDNIACGKTWLHVGQDMDMSNRRKLGNFKLKESDVLEIKKFLSIGYSRKDLASIFNVSRSAINQIANGKNWKHVQV